MPFTVSCFEDYVHVTRLAHPRGHTSFRRHRRTSSGPYSGPLVRRTLLDPRFTAQVKGDFSVVLTRGQIQRPYWPRRNVPITEYIYCNPDYEASLPERAELRRQIEVLSQRQGQQAEELRRILTEAEEELDRAIAQLAIRRFVAEEVAALDQQAAEEAYAAEKAAVLSQAGDDLCMADAGVALELAAQARQRAQLLENPLLEA